MSVQVVKVGHGPDEAAVPVGVGIPQPTLDQLADADGFAAAPTGVPLSLRKGTDGVVRPEPAAAGEGGAVLAGHEHIQSAAQSVWTIPHNLGRYPTAWSLYDQAGRECGGYSVQHLDVDTCRVSMDLPTAGLIRLI